MSLSGTPTSNPSPIEGEGNVERASGAYKGSA